MVAAPKLTPGCRVRIVALRHGHNNWYLLGEAYMYVLRNGHNDRAEGTALNRGGNEVSWAVFKTELAVEPKDPTW